MRIASLFVLLLSLPAAAQPDLSIAGSLEPDDRQADPGDRVTVEYVVYNGGDTDVEETSVAFYLSTDQTLDASDDFIESESLGTDVEAGESEEENEQITLPSGVPDGEYYVLLVVDPNDVVAETDETNNVAAAEVYIGDPPPGARPDFAVTSLTVSPSTVEAGGTIVADYYVANQGDAYADQSYPGIYLSSDPTLSADDLFLREDFTDGIPAGSAVYEDAIIDIPYTVSSGDYYLIIAADYEDVVEELDETNNARSAALTVQGGGPLPVGEAGVQESAYGQGTTYYRALFEATYTTPVVVTPTYQSNDDTPAIVRVYEVDADGVTLRLENWGDPDDQRPFYRVPYLVFEAGVHTLADGRRVEAGRATTNANGAARVAFSTPFATRPVVFTQVITTNGQSALATRARVRADLFRVDLQTQEAATGPIEPETVAWIAIEQGAGTAEGRPYEAARSDRRVGSGTSVVRFGQTVDPDAVFLAATQSSFEADPVSVRLERLARVGARVSLQEEQSADVETNHTPEWLGYAVFAPGLIYQADEAARAPAPPEATATSPDAPGALAVGHRPNPVRDRAVVAFDLPAAAAVQLDVFDVIGRRVATPAAGRFEAGTHEVAVDVSGLPAGVFLYRLATDAGVATGRLTVAR